MVAAVLGAVLGAGCCGGLAVVESPAKSATISPKPRGGIRFRSAHEAIGVWRSLVARVVRDDEAAGSNPVTPTWSLPGEQAECYPEAYLWLLATGLWQGVSLFLAPHE